MTDTKKRKKHDDGEYFTRDEILSGSDDGRPYREIHVSLMRGGKEKKIRYIPASTAVMIETQRMGKGDTDESDKLEFMASVVAGSIVNKDGSKTFDDETVKNIPFEVLTTLLQVATGQYEEETENDEGGAEKKD